MRAPVRVGAPSYNLILESQERFQELSKFLQRRGPIIIPKIVYIPIIIL